MTPSISENTVEVSQSQPNEANQDVEVSKYSFRKDIWSSFDKNGLVTFPRPVRGRIPNFHGASDAADKLKATDVFRNATVVKVNADKPQETARLNVIVDKDKRMIVSPRRSDTHPLLEIKLPAPPSGHEVSPAVLRAAVTRQGMLSFCQPLTADQVPKIDLLVVGSVAVSRKGQRIGKCDGYSDLEFGYLCEIGAITPDTVIATTVHESQVFDSLPEHLFQEHDFPVDLIVTPTEVISIDTRPARPTGIIWNLLSNRRMVLSPNIVALHKQRVESGQDVHLKEEDTDEEVEREIRRKHRPFIHRFSRRPIRGKSEGGENAEQNQEMPRNKVRQRRSRRSTDNGRLTDANKTDTDGEGKKEPQRRLQPRRRPWRRQRILFTLRIGGITATDRVRDLKKALAARNVRPAEIAWFGRRGYAYVHFAKPRAKEPEVPIELETVVAHLKDMTLGEEVEGQEKAPLIVEAAAKRDEQNNQAVKPVDAVPDKLPSPSLGDAENIIVPPAEPTATVA